MTGGERSRILVPTITLDSLLKRLSPPTFIKIDVEGAEAEVLKGSRRILEEIRPVIYIETGKESHELCEKIICEAEYDMELSTANNWLCYPRKG